MSVSCPGSLLAFVSYMFRDASSRRVLFSDYNGMIPTKGLQIGTIYQKASTRLPYFRRGASVQRPTNSSMSTAYSRPQHRGLRGEAIAWLEAEGDLKQRFGTLWIWTPKEITTGWPTEIAPKGEIFRASTSSKSPPQRGDFEGWPTGIPQNPPKGGF